MPTPEMSAPELASILESTDFIDAVAEVAEYTAMDHLEAGFVVYDESATDNYRVSEIIRGHRVYNSFDDTLLETVDLGSLIKDEAQDFRQDIAVVLHSHPDTNDGIAPMEALISVEEHQKFINRQGSFANHYKSQLFPSDGDLKLYSNVSGGSRGHVSMILAANQDATRAGLLSFRHESLTPPTPMTVDLEHVNQYHKEYTLDLIQENGYLVAETEIDLKSKEILSKLGDYAIQLF